MPHVTMCFLPHDASCCQRCVASPSCGIAVCCSAFCCSASFVNTINAVKRNLLLLAKLAIIDTVELREKKPYAAAAYSSPRNTPSMIVKNKADSRANADLTLLVPTSKHNYVFLLCITCSVYNPTPPTTNHTKIQNYKIKIKITAYCREGIFLKLS